MEKGRRTKFKLHHVNKRKVKLVSLQKKTIIYFLHKHNHTFKNNRSFLYDPSQKVYIETVIINCLKQYFLTLRKSDFKNHRGGFIY